MSKSDEIGSFDDLFDMCPPVDRLVAIDWLSRGARQYASDFGLVVPNFDLQRVVASPVLSRRIAAAYSAAPRKCRSAWPAYEAFRSETLRQFAFLTGPVAHGGLGVSVEVSRPDPYPTAAAMIGDLRECRRLKVFATSTSGNDHPFLTNEENDQFRAVHDAFGHAAVGRGFDEDGEEAAWLAHSHMYSPLARRAMTTETRGQNTALIYTNGGAWFPEQKAVLLAPEFSDPRSATFRAMRP